MQLYSLGFIYCFLPISILLFYCVPARIKNAILFFVSVIFYSFLEPRFLWLMLSSVLFDYMMALVMEKFDNDNRKRQLALILSIIKSVGLILYTNIMSQLELGIFPAGILIYCLTALGYMIDIYRGDAPYEASFINFGLFCLFFGKIVVGPVVRYDEMRGYLADKRLSLSKMSTGVITFVGGVAKAVILAKGIAKIYTGISQIPYYEMTVTAAWLLVICLALTVYFTLSGYCDMARGLGMIFAMDLPRNFNYPFLATSIKDFVNRFNITYNRFVYRYVYDLLGGEKYGKVQTALNLLLTGMLMGLWFGVRSNYFLWGIYLSAFLMLEHFWLEPYLKRIPKLFGWLYTFCVIFFSFAIFAGNTISYTVFYMKTMFGLGNAAFINESISYLLLENYPLILIGLLFATDLVAVVKNALSKKMPKLVDIGFAGIHIVLLVVVTGYLVTGI